jgi:omega-6 fatty acid desaturase (delta-12 desaturase)
MENVIKKSDFSLRPYMRSNDFWATCQILNTVLPYIGLWFLAVQLAAISLWFLPPIMVLMTLFSGRCFSLMHDCGHYSLFRSRRVNRVVGFFLGVLNAIPQYPWSRGHAYHHKTNGDWERYRGPSGLISTEEFAQLTPLNQRYYRWLRHPLMLFPGGFFYLVIKPRLALIKGTFDFVSDLLNRLRKNPRLSLITLIASHKSRNWYTAGEFWDLLLNNFCVISGWIFLSHWLGTAFFLSIYSITLTCSGAIFIYVFFVQHNFEGSYAHKTAGWDYLKGAIEGSSYLELPFILKWFSASIGYHNIHHLSERIPNYNLEACHRANAHLLLKVKTLHLSSMLGCAKFILWDADQDRLVSIKQFHQAARLKAKLTRPQLSEVA